jgi:hypothetical protein
VRLFGAWALVSTMLLAACQNHGPSYDETILSRPMPQTDQERQQECNWIQGEIARQQNLAQIGSTMATSPLMAVAYQSAARNNIAALNARASNVNCTAAFSSAPAAPSYGQSFDQCFARCQQLTNRTKDQCFDACNH